MNQHVDLKQIRALTGYGGMAGGGKGGGGTATSGTEAPNSLRSRQVARVIDLLSEGPIYAVHDRRGGIYLDGVPLWEAGSYNFSGVRTQFVYGYPDQPIMTGFAAQENEQAVGVQLMYLEAVTRSILNTDVDRCRITVSVPALQLINKETGDISGTAVKFRVFENNHASGEGWRLRGNYTISGKTNSNYQRSVTLTLGGGGPRDIRVERMTPDSTTTDLQNDLFWDSYTEIIDDRVNFANSACVGIEIDAEQFRSIPKRVYDVQGLLILVPTNYDPDTGVYTGVWNGNFQLRWSNSPAWVLFDLITNNRYGLGDFVSGTSLTDKWSFYKIGRWCDALVPGKNGVLERRYLCDITISSQQEAFDLLHQMASIFRGFSFWTGGQMVGWADQPEDPVQQFTNASVEGGQFSYSGSDIRQRHNQINVAWNDPALLGQGRLAVVEDFAAISRYGIQSLDITAYGCTRESEAIRLGKWTLYSEQFEGETIHFVAGLEGAYLRPGSIVRVMDATIAGRRRGGRLMAGSTYAYIYFDAPIELTAGQSYQLSCVVGADAHVETRPAYVLSTGPVTEMWLSSGFTVDPIPDSVFVITETTLEATLWRVLAIRQQEADRYEVNGVRHYPQKWDYVEKNLAFSDPDISDIVAMPPAVQNLSVIEYLVQTSAISVGVRVTLSWTSDSPSFDVNWHLVDENWQHLRTDQHAVDLDVVEGVHEFQVTPISVVGVKGPTTTLRYEVIGRFALPEAPKQFRVNVVDGVAMFDWLPAPELDVIIGGHYELRYSTATTGATWNTAQTVVPSIPGSATSVEAGYQVGTWFLRTFDITGRASQTWATVIALAPDTRYQQYYRTCENPDWLGTHLGTEILVPQNWLVLGQTGGLWDDQTDAMDDWPDVDVLELPPGTFPPPAPSGTYVFEDVLDIGGLFSVRLSTDILAFPFYTVDETIDERMTPVDEWADWDDAGGELDGSVTILVRSTEQDPASPAAIWSDWKTFIPGEHFGWGFEFAAFLEAPPGQNIGVEELCVTVDVRNKIDAGEDVPYSAVETRVHYNVKFFNVPAVVITLQLAMAEDRVEVLNKTREYFDVKITQTSTGTNPVGARSFDWHATGY